MITTAAERAAVAAIAAQNATGYHYVAFHSALLGADVRVGLEFEGEEFNYQHCTIAAGWEIRDVWIAGANLSQFLQDVILAIETEAIAAMEASRS